MLEARGDLIATMMIINMIIIIIIVIIVVVIIRLVSTKSGVKSSDPVTSVSYSQLCVNPKLTISTRLCD